MVVTAGPKTIAPTNAKLVTLLMKDTTTTVNTTMAGIVIAATTMAVTITEAMTEADTAADTTTAVEGTEGADMGTTNAVALGNGYDLPPYSGTTRCPKCRGTVSGAAWCPGDLLVFDNKPNPERMKRSCGNCSYEWFELPADHAGDAR